MEKQRWEESEKRKEEERNRKEDQRKERVKRKKMHAFSCCSLELIIIFVFFFLTVAAVSKARPDLLDILALKSQLCTYGFVPVIVSRHIHYWIFFPLYLSSHGL